MINPVNNFNRQVSYAISQFQEHPSDTALFSARVTELLSEIPSSITTEEQSSLLSRSLQDLSDTCATPELTPVAEKVNTLRIKMLLNTWALTGEPDENRAEAKKRILAFLHSPTSSALDLSELKPTDLPDIFNHPSFSSRLTKVFLNDTPLISLPESFGSLTALQKLYLNGTRLTSLPESFGNLIALQELDLSETQLASLPESFGSLIALKRLDLNVTQLASLPESFSSLIALQRLGLMATALTSLPESFSRLIALQRLDLSGSWLNSLPSTIISLPHNLEIDISNVPLSEEIRSRLQAATEVPGYNGPSFIYSMAHLERREEDRRSTVELVRDLYQELGELPLTLNSELEASAELRAWLSRLSYMADYKAEGKNKKALLQNILSYLRLANENSEFRDSLLAVINDAAETCGDRVALSILQIGIAYKVHTADLSRPRDLAHLLLRGVYAISLLENIARAKVLTLRFVDEIEVYLGYPLKLKEALDLPIDVKEMLHFACSALTDPDLSNAESFVKEHLDNPDTCHQFLIHHETWLKCLEKNYPREFRALIGAKAADVRVNPPDYRKIQTDYEKGLIDLTKKALNDLDETREASELISPPPLKKIKR